MCGDFFPPTGFVPLFWTEISSKDFSRTFKDTFPIFYGLHSMLKKKPWVCVLAQLEQFYSEGLSLFFRFLANWESGLEKVSTKFQGLSGTDCNFQGFSRPWIFILKFKDCQGDCKPWKIEEKKNQMKTPAVCFLNHKVYSPSNLKS